MSDQAGSAAAINRSSQRKIWIPPCILAGLILLFSSTPGAYYPSHPDFINNIVHLVEFGLLSFLLARALQHSRPFSAAGLFLLTTAVCVLFGALDEAHQFLVPERMFDLTDLFFDFLGSVFGSGSYLFLRMLKTKDTGTGTLTTGDMDD